MRLLVLSDPDVHALLSYPACVSAVRDGLAALTAGQADQPLRTIIRSASAPGLMGLMPAYAATPGASGPAPAGAPDPGPAATPGASGPAPAGAYGLKAICITPGNPAAGLDTHQGIVLLSDGPTGQPLAVLNASAVTEIRTAATSVLATQLLARPGAGDLAVLGTGVQARAHVRAFSQAGSLRRVRVAGRDPARAAAFAAALQPETGVPVTPCASAAEAAAGADIIVTATTSATPVLRRAWISDGAHVNAVGACLPAARELDGPVIGASALYCDSRDGLAAESGDYRLAVAEGLAGPASIRGTLGEVLAGRAPGRSGAAEITVFESLGLAVEDLAAARAAYQAAVATGAGQWVTF
jgi:ornithine cyclodeaminase/alanine dehydrogenase-like protein (mu-crystallin family)